MSKLEFFALHLMSARMHSISLEDPYLENVSELLQELVNNSIAAARMLIDSLEREFQEESKQEESKQEESKQEESKQEESKHEEEDEIDSIPY